MNYALKILFKNPYHLLKNRWGRQFLWLCFKYGNKSRYKGFTTSLFGERWVVADNMSFLWQFHDIFVKQVYHFSTKKESPLIIDCGSNIGLSILYFKKHYPNSKIIAFEADPEIFKIQQENINSLSNIESYGKAVWTHNNGIKLFSNQADGAYITENGEVNVQSTRLRDLLSSHETIDLLKLDVEGAEFEIISDCSDQLHKVDKLFIELHTFSGQKQKVAKLLEMVESAGFRYFIENANDQKEALYNAWLVSDTGMDMQLNLYAIRE